jgi:hypothetical protein
MIKITVNRAVCEALSKALSKPANAGHRILNKYVTELQNMLLKSLHFRATALQSK